MNKLLRSLWMYRLLRWIIGGWFLVAGIAKLLQPTAFSHAISDFGLVADSLLMPTAWLLILLEIIAGVGLIGDMPGSLPLVASLLLLFTGVLGYGAWLGLDISCGCLGPLASDFFPDSLRFAAGRNVLLLAGCAVVYMHRGSTQAWPSENRRDPITSAETYEATQERGES